MRRGSCGVLLGFVGMFVASAAIADGPLRFFSLTPCRAVDTRAGNAPALSASTTRDFQLQGVCGVPVGAKSVVVNITVATPSGQGHLRLFPSGVALPNISTINFTGSDVALANGAIVTVSTNANDVSVYTFMLGGVGTVHLILDVTGYFATP